MGSHRVGHDWSDLAAAAAAGQAPPYPPEDMLVSLFPTVFFVVCAWSVTKLCPTLCEPVDCSLPGSSVYGISQARILEWVAVSSSRGSSRPRNQTHISCVSCIGRRILYHWSTREAMFIIILLLMASSYWALLVCQALHWIPSLLYFKLHKPSLRKVL